MLHSWSMHDAEQPWGADPGGPEALVAELRQAGGQVVPVAADFADPDAPHALVIAARDAFEHVDAVIANHARSSRAGSGAAHCDRAGPQPRRSTPGRRCYWLRRSAQHDDTRPGGRVPAFTSGQYHGAMPAELPYIASKAALHELTRSLAVHLMPRGSTVNCIDSGPNDTGYADEQTRVAVAAAPGRAVEQPGRHRSPGHLAAQRRGRLDHGQTIASDGGWSAR